MDKKWKLSKEDPCSHSSSSSSSPFLRSMSHKSSTKSLLLRSFSQKISTNSKSNLFSRSSSQKNSKSPCDLSRSSSQKCANFTRKCGHLAKEQKARFYIVKRCVTMLMYWVLVSRFLARTNSNYTCFGSVEAWALVLRLEAQHAFSILIGLVVLLMILNC
ncbi:hypothetical protein R6Q57_004681 [Mikania cordata]